MHSAFVVLLTVASFAAINAHFQCVEKRRNADDDENCATTTASSGSYASSAPDDLPKPKILLDLGLVRVETICYDVCNNCSGAGQIGGAQNLVQGALGGIVGGKYGGQQHGNILGNLLGGGSGLGGLGGASGIPAASGVSGVASPASGLVGCLGSTGNQLTNYQACVFQCVVSLNVLDKCDIDAILSRVDAICSLLDQRALCVSVCACCSADKLSEKKCLDLCLVRTNGNNTNVDIPVYGSPIPTNLLPQTILPILPGVYLGSGNDNDHQTTTAPQQGGGGYGSGNGGNPAPSTSAPSHGGY